MRVTEEIRAGENIWMRRVTHVPGAFNVGTDLHAGGDISIEDICTRRDPWDKAFSGELRARRTIKVRARDGWSLMDAELHARWNVILEAGYKGSMRVEGDIRAGQNIWMRRVTHVPGAFNVDANLHARQNITIQDICTPKDPWDKAFRGELRAGNEIKIQARCGWSCITASLYAGGNIKLNPGYKGSILLSGRGGDQRIHAGGCIGIWGVTHVPGTFNAKNWPNLHAGHTVWISKVKDRAVLQAVIRAREDVVFGGRRLCDRYGIEGCTLHLAVHNGDEFFLQGDRGCPEINFRGGIYAGRIQFFRKINLAVYDPQITKRLGEH
jgi:hypothetical protein